MAEDISDLPAPGIEDLPAPPDSKLKQWGKTALGAVSGAAADIAGLVPGVVHNVADAGRLTLATARAALPGNSFADTPGWMIPSGATTWKPQTPLEAAGTVGQIKQGMQNIGVPVGPADPNDPYQRYAGAGLEGAAAALMTGGTGVGPALAGAGLNMASTGLHDAFRNNPNAEELAQLGLMFGPMALTNSTRAWAAGKLKAIVANNPARSMSPQAAADRFMDGNLTVAQTTDSGAIRALGAQVQGTTAARAGQVQADIVAGKLAQQARALAPVPVTAPNASAATVGKVSGAIDKMHTDLSTQASDNYTRGSNQVAQLVAASTKATGGPPAPIAFPSLTKAVGNIAQEAQDIFNTAPAELQPRIKTLMTALGASQGGAIQAPDAVAAMKLGKAINQQYSATERGAITPAMDQVFAQLKSAYKSDLESAPSNPAIDRLRSVNREYSQAQDRIKTLEDSVVNGVVGSLGTKDPDAAISKLAGMSPHAQRYTRDILLKYDPDTLRALQGHYIDLHLNAAMPAGRGGLNSQTDIHALNPAELAKTGIFDTATAQKLMDAQNAVNTIRSFFPEAAGNKVGLNLQEGSRLAGGAAGGMVSPVFALGAALRVATGGKLEKLLLTPEGRAQLMQGASDPQAAMKLMRNVALLQARPQNSKDKAAQ